jgi:hypothetical protein
MQFCQIMDSFRGIQAGSTVSAAGRSTNGQPEDSKAEAERVVLADAEVDPAQPGGIAAETHQGEPVDTESESAALDVPMLTPGFA